MKSLILIILFVCFNAHAKKFRKNRVDRAHRNFSNGIVYFSNEVDAFFADDKHAGLPNRSSLKLSFITNFREASGPYTVPDINYSLVLPRTEKRLRLVLENENEDIQNETYATNYQRQRANRNRSPQDSTAAGIRYMVEKSGIKFYQDTGVIVDVPPKAFVRWTVRKEIMLRDWLLKLREQIRWVNTTGIRSTLNIDFDRGLTRNLLLRMVNDTLWNDTDYTVTFENGPSLFQRIDEKKALQYHAHVITNNKPNFEVSNYLLQITYRQNVYKDWLFMNLTPFVNFPRELNFHRTPGFLFRFDMIFGSI